MQELRYKYNSILEEIADTCFEFCEKDKEVVSTGLFSGELGKYLFRVLYEKRKGSNLSSLDDLEGFLGEYRITTPSLCNGFAGADWLLSFFDEYDLLEYDSEIKGILKNNSSSAIKGLIKNKDFDFLHGAMGMLYAYIENNDFIDSEIISLLSSYTNISSDNLSYFQTSTDALNEINLHLAHGISSHIIVLSELLKKLNQEDQLFIKRMIESNIEILRKNLISEPSEQRNHLSLFPYYDRQNINQSDIRLAWCYGDFGIGMAFQRAGTVLENNDWIEFSEEIWLDTLSRKQKRNVILFDSPVCHGLFGNLLFYYRIYGITEDDRYLDIIDLYLDKIGRYYRKYGSDMFGSYLQNEYNINSSILTGTSGIGLTALTILDESFPKWDKPLLTVY